jgi:hypothetical protein
MAAVTHTLCNPRERSLGAREREEPQHYAVASGLPLANRMSIAAIREGRLEGTSAQNNRLHGMAIAQSQASGSWRMGDIPGSDGVWRESQLAMSRAGVVIIAAGSWSGYGGPEDGDGHVFAFIGR